MPAHPRSLNDVSVLLNVSLCLLKVFPPYYNRCLLESVLSQLEFCTGFDKGWSPVYISALPEVCQVPCLILSGRRRRAAFMRGGWGALVLLGGRCPACLEQPWPHLAPVPRGAGFSPTRSQRVLACREPGWPGQAANGWQREKVPLGCEMRQNQERRGSVPHSCDLTPSLPGTACAFQSCLFFFLKVKFFL